MKKAKKKAPRQPSQSPQSAETGNSSPLTEGVPQLTEAVQLGSTENEPTLSRGPLKKASFGKKGAPAKTAPKFVSPAKNMMNQLDEAHANVEQAEAEYSSMSGGKSDYLSDIKSFKKTTLKAVEFPKKKKVADNYDFEQEEYEIPKGKPMTLDYERLYADYLNEAEGTEAYPIHKIKYIILQISARSDTTLDFSGIAVLTDITFALLSDLHTTETARVKAVTSVVIDGCYQITDAGLTWLGKAFPNLMWLSCVGCPLVTDAGILSVSMNCPNLTSMDISGTQVTILPKRWANADGIRMNCTPVLYPRTPADSKASSAKGKQPLMKPEGKDLFNVVVAHRKQVDISVLCALKGEKQPDVDKLLNIKYQSNISLTPDLTASIVEGLQSLAPLFITNRSVVAIPSTLKDKTKIKDEAMSIASLVVQIKAKHPQVPIILVGLSSNAQGIVPTAFIKENVLEIINKLSSVIRDKHPVLSSPKREAVVDKCNVSQQLELSRSISLLQGITDLRLLDFEFNVDKDNTKPLSSAIVDAAKGIPCFEHATYDKEIYDWALSFPSKCPKGLKSGVIPLDNAAQVVSSNSTFKERMRPFGAVQFLRDIGQFCVWNDREKGEVVTNNEWLCSVLSTLMSVTHSGQKNTGQSHVVDDGTPLWLKTTLKEEMEKANVAWTEVEEVIRCHSSLFISSEATVTPWTSLSLVSKLDLDYFTNFDKDSQTDTCMHIMRSYALDINITPAVLHSILSHALKLHAPVHVWQTGVVINDGMVAVMIASTGYSKIVNLCVYMPFFARDIDSKIHSSLLWSTFNRYAVIIEYFLATFGLEAEKILRAPTALLPEPAKATCILNNHKVKDDTGMCDVCGVTIAEATMLGAFHKALKPSFWNEKIKSSDQKSLQGSIIKFSGKCVARVRAFITPIGNNECCFTLVQGTVRNLKIILECFAPVYKITLDLKEKMIHFGDKSENITSQLGEGTLQGCIIKASLRGSAPFFMDFYMGPKLLASSNVPGGRYDISFDSENEGAAASVSLTGATFVSRSSELRVGMRLEAFDRKTPTLICVATIEQIKGEQILIHFDGWSGHYDYWTEWDTPDLHPLGYMEYMKETNGHKTRVNKALQIPNRYNKQFTWPTYLKEMESEPVPYELFSEEQKQGTPPKATEEALDYLGIAFTKGDSDPIPLCSPKLLRGSQFKADMKRLTNQKSKEVNVKTDEFNWYIFLPNNLSLETLRFPVLKDLFDMKKMNLHFLCDWHGVEFHFSNHPGLPLTTAFQSVEKWTLLQLLPCIMLWLQKETLPPNPYALIPGAEKLTSDQMPQLELGLRRLLQIYISYAFVMMEALNTVDGAKEQEVRKSVLDSAKELVKVAMKDDKTFAQNFHFKTGSESIVCQAHALAHCPQMDIQEIMIDKFLGFTHRIYTLCYNGNPLTQLPGDMFTHFDNLIQLLLCDCSITELPSFAQNISLEEIDVRNNKLTSLPSDIEQLKNLKILQISNNPLKILPPKISSLTSLIQLEADNIGKVDINIICKLVKLESLKASFNHIEELPEAFCQLPLQTLYIAGLPVMSQSSSFAASSINNFLDTIVVYNLIEAKDRQEMIEKADNIGDNNASKISELNKLLKARFPQFTKTKGIKDGEIPSALFKLASLEKLHLSNNSFVTVPDTVKQLTALQSLNLESNPHLESVSAELANLPLKELHLRDCAVLKTPPKEVVRRGFLAVFGFLKRLLQGSVLCKRTKLMMVGLGGAGKTSLVRALTHKSFSNRNDQEQSITDGIDITEWSVDTQKFPSVDDASSQEPLRFSVWDFAGQTVYYNTHQFFLSNRAVYLLLWNIRLGFEHAGLDFWLSSVTCHAPKAPIVVVGTHCDKVERGKIPTEELKRKFPKIVAFHFVSSYSGEGIDNLRIEVIKSALKQEYMGEKIPEAWLSLETGLDKVRSRESLIKWEEIESVASTSGIFDKVELTQSVQFLHDLGSVQFFNTPFLKSHVVIVPQWIVDVMACIVTVHDGPTKDGKLKHSDMVTVWQDYPKELHPWLLRLTEEFDLTFPISNENANIVPCLLPNSEPQFEFSPINKDKFEREAQMVYRFQYLPAGLFNRAQVRLHQFSDTSLMWKKGFMLKKNDHRALLLQTSNTEVDVTARGYKPENIIFLIHEVIECLIADSYSGVSYDFSLPCLDCASNFTLEPSMFHASKVKRALEMKAPFLQCDKHFHIVSIPEIRAAMPPDRESDFDEHLSRSVRELQELGESMAIKCLFIYSKKNVPDLAQEGKVVNPINVLADLRGEGFNVSYCDDPETTNMESMTLGIKAAQNVIIGISDDFVQSEQCKDIIIYIKQTLNKNITLLVLGATTNWQKTDINLVLADELFVRMADVKSYPVKLKELKEAIKTKVLKKKVAYPDCFISYCWANSKKAVELGTPKKDGALGWADPREIKEFLQSKGVNCWLDVNQMGQEGFFEDIADGLRKAKVMVACVSDEYANSKNCKMEFRFALSALKIPTVLAVVGTGYLWERSEIGLLTVGHSSNCPKINLQYPNEGGMLDLLKAVQAFIPVEDKDKKLQKDNVKSQQDVALQEVLELAQRKLLRQIMMYADNLDTEEYPRLIIVDLYSDEAKQAKDWKPEIENEMTEDTRPKSETYCFRLFCEHEMGWHESPVTIPAPSKETTAMNDFLNSVSAYTVRLMAVLKHTKNSLPIFNKPEGEQIQRKMEEWCNRTNSDFQSEFKALLDVVLDQDINMTYGGLKKCNMPNKKSLWLCPMHQKDSLTQTDGKFKDETPGAEVDETGADVDLDNTRDSGSSISEFSDMDPSKEKPQEDAKPRYTSVTLAKPGKGPVLPPSRPKMNRHVSGKKTSSQACRLM